MPLGSQQKITLIGTQLPGELQIASAVGATGNVLTISPTEQSRINVSTVNTLIIADPLARTQIPLSIHSFMAMQVALAGTQTQVYLALPGQPAQDAASTFLLYRLAPLGPREPTFLLVQESVAPHVIEVLDPAFTPTPSRAPASSNRQKASSCGPCPFMSHQGAVTLAVLASPLNCRARMWTPPSVSSCS